jgi:drug/metabolite transporter (DMT)-like permease
VAGSAAALFGAGALVVRGPAALVAVPPAAWWAIGALALPCTVLAFLLFMRGIDRLGPVRTAIVSTVEPLFTAVLGAVALGQALRAPTLVGGALIAGAVALLQLRPRPRR